MTTKTDERKWVIEATTSTGSGYKEGVLERLTDNAPPTMADPVFLGSLDGSIGAIFEVTADDVGQAIRQGDELFRTLLNAQEVTLVDIDYLAAHRYEEIDPEELPFDVDEEEDPFDDLDTGEEDVLG